MKRARLARLLVLLAGVLPAAEGAELWGLVVGINDYAYKDNLYGAVNDARDIEAALRDRGAREVRVLLDREATRGAITHAWQALVARAAPGDTLVFSYSGHGIQEPERVPGSEVDGQDETLALAGFRAAAPGNGERLPDDELARWFAAADHLNVVFVADTCHSGTLYRSIDPRAPRTRYRYIADYGTIVDDELPLPARIAGVTDDDRPPAHVTFLAATLENRVVPEVIIDDRWRGALSWAFARALRGAADRNGDGMLTRAELRGHVISTVRMRNAARQVPRLLPFEDEQRPVLPIAAGGSPVGTEAPVAGLLRLGIIGPDGAQGVLRQLRHVEPAAAKPPDLVWDAGSGEVIDALGDVVAREVDPDRLQGVIDKWRLLDTLKRQAADAPLALRVRPDDGLHHAGERVGFVLDDHRHPYLTVFNLAADGTVQHLYPIDDREAGPVATDGPFDLFGQIEVTGPFGADHLVAVVTAEPATALRDRLRAFDGRRAAASLQELLPQLLDGAHQLGITGLYTAP